MRKSIGILIFILTISFAMAEDFAWPFLDTKAMGTYEFIQANPGYDGRGVLVFIVDCGVDPLIPGLLKTSEGNVKLVDLQDFTGQLVLTLSEAKQDTSDSGICLRANSIRLSGWEKLDIKPADGKYFLGQIDEASSYKNSAVKDINNNGKTNDVFPVLVFKSEKGSELLKNASGLVKPDEGEDIWVYYVDQDTDGNIDDEKPMFDYKYNYDAFNFHRGQDSHKPLLTLAANIDPSGPSITIVTCDGSHGTHCAGIAAGNKIGAIDGNNGVAPGAYVASLKIGSNILSGGATTTASMTKAYEYGLEFMTEAGFDIAVFSMSYGIGSETPERSEIDKWLNNFAFAHPEAVIVKSMGNAGPGINSTGNPSGAQGVISVGAMIPPQTLENLYGSKRNIPWVTHFSSRGGETAKPDVIAPGAAASTVPAFSGWDAFWGTSMSTPQVAGACAVLLSAAKKEGLRVNSFMVKKALKYTANPMRGYTALDYGNGLVDIPEAWTYLKILAKRNEAESLDYKIETENTFFDDNKGSAAFWRTGGYFTPEDEKQGVSVSAIYPDDMPEKEKHEFYRIFRLRSDASWLETDKSKIYIRDGQPGVFNLIYDHSKIKKPGVYVGRISAYPESAESGGFAEFDVQATVVVPHKFGFSNKFTLEKNSQSLGIGEIERIFVQVPAGASAMRVQLKPDGNKYFNMGLYLCSPDGNKPFTRYMDNNDNADGIVVDVDSEKLQDGTWEIIPYCFYQALKPSHFDLKVQFFGLETDPPVISSMCFGAGEKPTTEIALFNHFGGRLKANISGSIKGYQHKKEYSQSGKPSFSKSIKAGSDISKIVFRIDMPTSEFNKVTDLAVNVYDASGKAIVSTGMSRKHATITFAPPAPGEYTFEMVPAFATDQIMAQQWNFGLTEEYHYKNPIKIAAEQQTHLIYPADTYRIKLEAAAAPPMAPESCRNFGEVRIIDADSGALLGKARVLLNTK